MPDNTNLIVKEGTKSINVSAFSGMHELSSIQIPESMARIGYQAFYNCSSLKHINLPEGLKKIEDFTFSGCSSLDGINIPKTVTNIGTGAFEGCKSLQKITIPKSVITVGAYAFYDCTGLKSALFEDGDSEITFENRVGSYMVETFTNCHVDKLYMGRTMYYWPLNMSPFRNSTIDSLIVGANIDSNDSYRKTSSKFKDCQYLEIKKQVTRIKPIDFCGFPSLKSVVVEKENTKFDSRDNCNAIIETATNTLVVGNKNSIIPKSINSIGPRAFYNCIGLTTIDIPYGVSKIENNAFASCKDLKSIKIPYSTLFIDDLAFSDCTSLKDIFCLRMPSTYGTQIFRSTDISLSILHVPSSLIGAFKLVSPWKDFGSIIELPRYKLIYSIDGNEYRILEVEEGLPISEESSPTKDGYTFSGWSEIPETMPAHDVTVTGTFMVNKYKLTYTVDGVEYKSFEVEYGTELTAEAAPTKEGFTFSGWSEIPETMPAHDVTVTGIFTINKYKLTYIVDGLEYKSSEVEYGASITAEAEPTKEGYTFSGWSEIPETMPASDVTVTGTFTVNSYMVTYVIDGEVYETVSVDYGTVIVPLSVENREGYTFNGWKDIPETMPAHDITVTGSFKVNSYTLTYMVDGEEYESYSIKYNANIEAEDEPTKDGYTFSGWSEIPEKMPAHDVTVTGTFTVNTYKVTYVIDNEVYATDSVDYGAAITPPVVEDKEGYTFNGWADVPETMPANDITIYGMFVSGISEIGKDEVSDNLLYTFDGIRIEKPRRGAYIIRRSDGTIKKILVK